MPSARRIAATTSEPYSGAPAAAGERWGASFCCVTPGLLSGEIPQDARHLRGALQAPAAHLLQAGRGVVVLAGLDDDGGLDHSQGAVDRGGNGPGDNPHLPQRQRPTLDGDTL